MKIHPKKISRDEALLVLAVCVIPPDIWTASDLYSNYQFLSLGLTTWDFIGIISYSLLYAFLDIILLFGATMFIGWLLPKKWWGGNKFVPFSVLFVTGLTLVAELLAIIPSYFSYLPNIGIAFLLWLMLSSFILQHSPRLKRILTASVERVSLLSYLYLSINLIGVVIVIIRNIPS